MDLAVQQFGSLRPVNWRRLGLSAAALVAGCIFALMVAPWVMPGLRGGSEVSTPPVVLPRTPVHQESVPATAGKQGPRKRVRDRSAAAFRGRHAARDARK